LRRATNGAHDCIIHATNGVRDFIITSQTKGSGCDFNSYGDFETGSTRKTECWHVKQHRINGKCPHEAAIGVEPTKHYLNVLVRAVLHTLKAFLSFHSQNYSQQSPRVQVG
jgi:hypothetical protein